LFFLIPLDWPIGNSIQIRRKGQPVIVPVPHDLDDFVVEICLSASNHVDDHQAYSLIEVVSTFCRKGPAGFLAIFISWTDQFDSRN